MNLGLVVWTYLANNVLVFIVTCNYQQKSKHKINLHICIVNIWWITNCVSHDVLLIGVNMGDFMHPLKMLIKKILSCSLT